MLLLVVKSSYVSKLSKGDTVLKNMHHQRIKENCQTNLTFIAPALSQKLYIQHLTVLSKLDPYIYYI